MGQFLFYPDMILILSLTVAPRGKNHKFGKWSLKYLT